MMNRFQFCLYFAFNFKLRRYIQAPPKESPGRKLNVLIGTWNVGNEPPPADLTEWLDVGRGLHSSTFRLNVSTFCWIRWVHDICPVY